VSAIANTVERIRRGLTRKRLRRVAESAQTVDEDERELVEGRYDDWKADAFAASGNGVGAPALPETTPKELYEEFELDQAPPPDQAP
jgi:hypothetical protein